MAHDTMFGHITLRAVVHLAVRPDRKPGPRYLTTPKRLAGKLRRVTDNSRAERGAGIGRRVRWLAIPVVLALALVGIVMARDGEPDSTPTLAADGAVVPQLSVAEGIPRLVGPAAVTLDGATSLAMTGAQNRDGDVVDSAAYLEMGVDAGFRQLENFPTDVARPVAGRFGDGFVVVGHRCESTTADDLLPCVERTPVAYAISTKDGTTQKIADPPPGTSFWVADHADDGPTFTFSTKDGLTAASYALDGRWTTRPLPPGTQMVCDRDDGTLIAYASGSDDPQTTAPPARSPEGGAAGPTTQPAASGTAVVTWSAYQLDDDPPKLLTTAGLQTVLSTDGEPSTTVVCGPDGSAVIAIEKAIVSLSPDKATHHELLRMEAPGQPMILGWYDDHRVVADTFTGGYSAVDTRSTDMTDALADLDIDPSTIISASNSRGQGRLVANDGKLTISKP